MKRCVSAALAVIAATVCVAGTAHAAPTDVSVRIEGRAGTTFDRVVRSDGHEIQSASDTVARKCDGTNLGANPEPGPTPTAATVDAMTINGTDFDGQWYDGYDDYFINRWGPDAEDNSNGWWWGILVNREFTPVGGCQYRLMEGDEVLWVYEAFNGRPFLSLAGPQKAIAGRPVEVEVTNFAEAPYAGATVSGLTAAAVPVPPAITVPGTSDAAGAATVTFNQPGWKRLKASDPGTDPEGIADAVPSNSIDICVERVAGSGCSGEAPSQIPAVAGEDPAVEIEEPGPPTCETDSSLCPPEPSCEADPALCPPNPPKTGSKLRFSRIDLGSRRIAKGGSARVGVSIENTGDSSAEATRVCLATTLKAPRKRGLKIPKGCRDLGSLGADQSRKLTFTVIARRTLTGRGKVPLRIGAEAEGADPLSRVVRLGLLRSARG